ncbi:MAG TPA: glycine cleavage T C-terminal barrel domain-containing protein, partial [Turneriella sp.]|nr:glycine cleavage T C-terminal barrel domain-containing protein [Turneriella sp.]
ISDTVKIEPWDNYTLLAVQGPDAPKLLEAKFPEIKNLYYYEVAFRGEDTFIARMGYTGEDGFEIACPQAEGIALWKELIAAGAKPCGLAARDVLRLEALMPLYGHELSSTLRPQESGLGFLYSDHTSIAPAALRNQATAQNSFGFQMQGEGIPRQGYKVVRESGEVVGEVTSGTFSFTQNCGMGFMRIDIAQKDKALFVEIRGEKKPIAVLEKTPIKGSVRRRPK